MAWIDPRTIKTKDTGLVFQLLLYEELEEVLEALPESGPLRALLGALQVALITFVTGFLGVKFARPVGFKFQLVEAWANKKPSVPDTTGMKQAVVLGLLVALVIAVSERYFFHPRIPLLAEMTTEFSWIALVSGIFYGGIVEEVLLRLFLMSLLCWVLMKLLAKDGVSQLPAVLTWAVVVLVAVIFAALHIPNASLLFGELTGIALLRILLLNTLGGVVYGWLYWQRGIEYAIVSHMMTHVGIQALFLPIFF